MTEEALRQSEMDLRFLSPKLLTAQEEERRGLPESFVTVLDHCWLQLKSVWRMPGRNSYVFLVKVGLTQGEANRTCTGGIPGGDPDMSIWFGYVEFSAS